LCLAASLSGVVVVVVCNWMALYTQIYAASADGTALLQASGLQGLSNQELEERSLQTDAKLDAEFKHLEAEFDALAELERLALGKLEGSVAELETDILGYTIEVAVAELQQNFDVKAQEFVGRVANHYAVSELSFSC
jgi:hypothetical protein